MEWTDGSIIFWITAAADIHNIPDTLSEEIEVDFRRVIFYRAVCQQIRDRTTSDRTTDCSANKSAKTRNNRTDDCTSGCATNRSNRLR